MLTMLNTAMTRISAVVAMVSASRIQGLLVMTLEELGSLGIVHEAALPHCYGNKRKQQHQKQALTPTNVISISASIPNAQGYDCAPQVRDTLINITSE